MDGLLFLLPCDYVNAVFLGEWGEVLRASLRTRTETRFSHRANWLLLPSLPPCCWSWKWFAAFWSPRARGLSYVGTFCENYSASGTQSW